MSVYPKKIATLDDHVKYSNQLKPQIKKLAKSILCTGTDVVMDFPANTLSQREWFRGVFTDAEAPHVLIYIDASDELCLEQIEKRRIEQPERAATDTAEMFEMITKYFAAPTPEEGFVTTRLTIDP